MATVKIHGAKHKKVQRKEISLNSLDFFVSLQIFVGSNFLGQLCYKLYMFFLVGIFPMDPFIWIWISMGIWNPPTSEGCTSMVSKNSCLNRQSHRSCGVVERRGFSEKTSNWSCGVVKRGDFYSNCFFQFPKHKRSNPRSQLSQLAGFYSWQEKCRKFYH